MPVCSRMKAVPPAREQSDSDRQERGRTAWYGLVTPASLALGLAGALGGKLADFGASPSGTLEPECHTVFPSFCLPRQSLYLGWALSGAEMAFQCADPLACSMCPIHEVDQPYLAQAGVPLTQ